ncbi:MULTISPECIES: LytR/AlgR family response regulator transcription factor [Niastella]|uniref:Response regulator transcription factor n=1 Tax=Niastella soli TaxID=2821487 RepID=A0ABS3YX85_9BACT|nr:LytTR family DNA-binding domain-containing protein [Niastella soli]MBO9202122.1 response regulator transcription factor [Niastella soli]
MKLLNCVIIEDNPVDRLVLEEYLSKYSFINITAKFPNPVESLEYLKTHIINILFLDVDMPVINGIDFLKTFPDPPPCIMVTAHPEYAIDAFEVQAIDYLLKPVKPERLDVAIQRTLELQEIKSKAVQYSMHFENDFLMIKEGTVLNKVNIADILYLEALTNYTKVVTMHKKYITLNNLKSFLDNLPPKRFLRIHRSYAVAVDKIRGVYKNELQIVEQRLPLGKTYRQEIKKLFTESN